MRLRTAFLLLLMLVSLPLAAKEITFSGGSTRIRMQQGFETISLSGGAKVSSDSLTLEAKEITLSGSDYRYIRGSGNVRLVDSERGIRLSSEQLFYDREEELVLISGYVELEDTVNEVLASAFSLEFNLNQALVLLQVEVRLLKSTERGYMECKSDSLQFDRDAQSLVLEGNATIDWAKDYYKAELISVDLDTEEITMGGSIEGVIYG